MGRGVGISTYVSGIFKDLKEPKKLASKGTTWVVVTHGNQPHNLPLLLSTIYPVEMGVECPDGEHHTPHNLLLLLSTIYPVEMGFECPDGEHHVPHKQLLYHSTKYPL